MAEIELAASITHTVRILTVYLVLFIIFSSSPKHLHLVFDVFDVSVCFLSFFQQNIPPVFEVFEIFPKNLVAKVEEG